MMTRLRTPQRHSSSASGALVRRPSVACAAAWRPTIGAPFAAGVAAVALLLQPDVALALNRMPDTPREEPGRCEISAFDKFASTRAKYSLEASQGMEEAIVDVRNCNFKNANLDKKVLSGVFMNNADCEGCTIRQAEVQRADMQDANLKGADFSDSSLYGTNLGGADLEGAQFENAMMTATNLGKSASGKWANLKGARFEGALLSSSDVERVCANPTLELDTKKYELGCRATK